jgi:hypothetical protein
VFTRFSYSDPKKRSLIETGDLFTSSPQENRSKKRALRNTAKEEILDTALSLFSQSWAIIQAFFLRWASRPVFPDHLNFCTKKEPDLGLFYCQGDEVSR